MRLGARVHGPQEPGAVQKAMPSLGRWSWLLVLAAALILVVPVIINGYPLLYDDTTAYMRRSAGALVVYLGPTFGSEWLDPVRTEWLRVTVEPVADAAADAQVGGEARPWTGGRSVYYGLAVYLLTLVGDLWGPALFQALVAGILLYLSWFRVLGLRSRAGFLLTCAFLAAASSLGYFAGLIMPDVFAGFTILSLALLLFGWDRLRGLARAVLFLIASFSIMAHDSHLLLAGGLLVAVLLVRAVRRLSGVSSPAIAGTLAVAACLAVGVLGNVAYHQAAVAVTGEPPLRLPHITAHMASLEPSVAYLRERCPHERWTVCEHVDEMPINWVQFMFGHPDIYEKASMDKRRRLSEEQLEIAGSMLMDRPVSTVGLFGREAGKQLLTFSYYDLGQVSMLRKDVPDRVQGIIQQSWLVRQPHLVDRLSSLQQWVVVLSLLPLLLLIAAGRRFAGESRIRELALFVLAGVVINAVICGVLAFPYDRFQTRVVWLIPAVTLLWLGLLLERRREERRSWIAAPAGSA